MNPVEITVMLATFVLMEGVAWAAHKYLMHGFLWFLHDDHHTKTPGALEKNDTFFLIFAIPSWLCIMLGLFNGNGISVAIGAGIALYGLAYALVHELFIHQRLPLLKKSRFVYWEAVRLAHKMHHRHLGKEDGENFGMLWVHPKYIRQVRQMRNSVSPVLETKWLYLLLNLFTVSIPLIRSFEPRIAYYKSFGSLGKAMLIWSGFFLVWDIWYTDMGVWGFTSDYLSGIELFGLPLGEYLFFVTVPFACVFIYKCMELFFPDGIMSERVAAKVSQVLIPFSLVIGIMSLDKLYTAATFILLGLALIYVSWIAKSHWLPRFYESYIIALLPFFLKNGILTGSFLESQVVWYNNAENLGIRLGTIPLKMSFYGMLLILGIVFFYEKFEATRKSRLKV